MTCQTFKNLLSNSQTLQQCYFHLLLKRFPTLWCTFTPEYGTTKYGILKNNNKSHKIHVFVLLWEKNCYIYTGHLNIQGHIYTNKMLTNFKVEIIWSTCLISSLEI